MTVNVIVFGQPNCSYCFATKKWLERKGIDHEYIDISEQPDQKARAEALADKLGKREMPIVLVEDKHGNKIDAWSSFRLDKLNRLSVVSAES